MHARFADAGPISPDGVETIIEKETVEARIMEFKQNPNNMAVLQEFIDKVVLQAEAEATKKRQQKQTTEGKESQQNKEKRQSFNMPTLKNGKVVNRARGFVVRLFDAICNCANNNAAAATTRFKMRGSTSGGGGGGNKRQQSQGSVDEPETLVLHKKKSSSSGAAEPKKKAKGVSMAEELEAGVRLVE